MAVEQLSFQGINRAASDFSNGGACEEMINLRPTGTGLVPVKPFSVKMHGVAYDKLYIHKAGAVTNYIAVKLDNGTLYIYHVSDDGIVLATIATVDVTGKANFSVSQVHFAYTGNIILFSICDKADNFYKNLSYLWDGTSYVGKNYDIPDLNITISSSTTAEFVERSFADASNVYSYARTKVIDEHNGREAKEYLVNSCNQFEEEHKDYCFGAVIIAIAYRTKSGQTFFTNKWFVYDPEIGVTENMHVVRYRSDMEIDGSHNIPYYFLLEQDPNGVVSVDDVDGVLYYPYTPVSQSGGDPSNYKKRLYNITQGLVGARVSLSFPKVSNDFDTDIESIEIYSTRPQFYFDDIFVGAATVGTLFFLLKHREYDDMSLDNQLFYYQKSVQISELKSLLDGETKDVQLQFGGNALVANKTLDVDAGATTRYGNLIAYNSRFHFFNSTRKVKLGMPDFVFRQNYSTAQNDVYAVYNDGQKDITVYLGTKELQLDIPSIVISPFLNVKEIITQRASGSLYVTRIYEMMGSKKYNYSICIDGGTTYTRQGITGAVTGPIFINEPSAINVTEQYEPAVFKVEHSYLAPGAVLDIQPQMVAVKDVTYGDYPLNVFTNRGLYALLQGNGVVLYGNFKSISNLITTANAIPTEMGTFFLAADGMWLIAGDTVVLVSDALSRGPHKFVRDAPGYYDICHDTYDVTQYVSAVSFEEFTKETAFSSAARLVYNRYRDELMVCNPDYDYCYVLSLKYRQWFKLAETYSQDAVGEIAFSGFSVSGHVVSEDSPAPYNTITVSFTIGGNTFTCNHYVANRERNARAIADALTSDCREAFAGTILSEISFVAALDASSNFRLSAILPKTIDEPQSVTASLFKIVNRAEETIFEGSFLFAIGRNVVSFEDEDELAHSILVHLQTRPFSIGYQYIHIHRIVAMIRARLASGHLIVNALYGSDDLQNWTLISYASRKNAQISQIRTPSAARSWRYYTVCIGGHVHWDTDLGTVLFDYQPVVRRIG